MIRSVVFTGSTPVEAKADASHFLNGKTVLAVIEHTTANLEFRKSPSVAPLALHSFIATNSAGGDCYVIMAFYDE